MTIGTAPFGNDLRLADTVREVVATTFGLQLADVHESLAAAELPAWDSLQHFTLIVALEYQLGVTYTFDEIPQMTNVPAIIRITAQRRQLHGTV